MPKTDRLFSKLLDVHQRELPALGADIATGHASNHKEHLGRLHALVTTLVRYVIADGAEKHGIDIAQLVAGTKSNDQAGATMSPQHFPASAPVALGAPPLVRQNVVVGAPSSQNISVGQPPTDAPDPEPDDKVQIITRLSGVRVVIPPRTSSAPKREFGPGQTVDVSYIAAANAATSSIGGDEG